MAPHNVRVGKAYRAMKNLGIEEGVVKPVLKNLLNVYDKNWELIEAENYRVLADAIFDQQDSHEEEKVAASSKKKKAKPRRREPVEEEEEDVPPSKRLRPRNRKGKISDFGCTSRSSQVGTSLKLPKIEREESPVTCTRQQSQELIELPQSSEENVNAGSHCPSSPPLVIYRRKRPASPTPLSLPLQSKSPLPCAADRTQPINYVAAPPPKHHRTKGKSPLYPQLTRRDNSSTPEKSSHSVRCKEGNVDPGIIVSPKQHSRSALPIKPKEEPFVDEIPHHEAPLAVIHPEQSETDNSSSGISSVREVNSAGPLVPKSADRNGDDRDDPATSSERRNNPTLQSIADESSSPNLEIASSPGGEVKISFACNSALERPDFHMPSIDRVLKMMEDRCVKSFKFLDPSFSAKNLLREFCAGIFELGTDTSDASQKIMDSSDARGGKSKQNGLANDQPAATEAIQSQAPEIAPSSKRLNEPVRNENLTESPCEMEEEKEQNSPEHADPSSSSVSAKCAKSHTPELPPASNKVDGCTEKNKNTTESCILISKENLEKDLEHTTLLSPVAVHELRGLEHGCSVVVGEEEVIVDTEKSLVNAVDTVKDLSGLSKTSIIAKCTAKAATSQMSRLPSLCNGMDESTNHCKDAVDIESRSVERNGEKNLECSGSRSLVVLEEHQLVPVMSLVDDVYDISSGHENVVISCSNEIRNECLPSFNYIPQSMVFQSARVNFSLAQIGRHCSLNCTGNCLSSAVCPCIHALGSDFAYTVEGLLKEEFLEECISMNRHLPKKLISYCEECPLERCKQHDDPCRGHLARKFIKECWWKCGCSKQCGNRVVQRGISCNLEVFMTPERKGLGVRTLENLPKGAFVCEYVGEILTISEISKRISESPNKEVHTYSVPLDADWASQGVVKDEDALFLDANCYGNVARFINHRCFDPNLVPVPVEMETPDRRYYHLAFFTTRNVKALEELTWDYGLDFDDQDHQLQAFQCCCGSEFCRNITRSRRSRSRSAVI